MGAGYSFNGFIGIAKETSGNVAVAAQNYLEAISEDLSASLDRFAPKNIIGAYYEPDDVKGLTRVGGSIIIPGNARDLGYLLGGALGIQSNTVILSGFLYHHEFKYETSDWDTKYAARPLTFEVYRDVTSSQQYAGCNISQLQLGVAPNQELRATAQIIGTAQSHITKTTPTFVSSPTDPFTFDTASISIGGSGVDTFEGFNLTLNRQLEGVPTLNNSSTISRIRRTGPQLVRLSGTVTFEDITAYLDFINQTERRITMSFTKSSSFQMVIDIPRFVYTTFPIPMSGRGRISASFDGMGRYHTGSATAVKIDLWNTTSGF